MATQNLDHGCTDPRRMFLYSKELGRARLIREPCKRCAGCRSWREAGRAWADWDNGEDEPEWDVSGLSPDKLLAYWRALGIRITKRVRLLSKS